MTQIKCLFLNNNPYCLEAFVVLIFKTDLSELHFREDIITQFKNLGCKLRTEERRFNSCNLFDSKHCDQVFGA